MMKRDKKHVAFFVPSLNIGGVESVFLTYSSMLVIRGYKVDFVVCKSEGALLSKVPTGVRLVDLGGIQLRKAAPLLRNYLKVSNVGTLITGPDITNFLSILVNLSLCRNKRVNLIVTQHNVMDDDAKSLGVLGRIIPFGKKKLYRYASSVVAVSNAVATDLIKTGVPPDVITTIYNPINIENIERLSVMNSDIHLSSGYIVFVGRLYKVKNVDLLIRAFELLDNNNLRLIIVGDGDLMEQWKQLAGTTSCSDRIIFTGSLTNPAPIIRNAQVVVVPSFSEAFPMVVVEAAALGKTIVHTPNLGCLEILGDQYGYCSSGFDDFHDFAVTLQRALDVPIDSEKMKSLVKKLDESEIIPNFEVLINGK